LCPLARARGPSRSQKAMVGNMSKSGTVTSDDGIELIDPEVGTLAEVEEDVILPTYAEAEVDAAAITGSLIDKSDLIGKAFVIYDYDFMPGKIKNPDGELLMHFDGVEREFREFVVVRIVTAPDANGESEYLVFTDGGTGVYKSLRNLADKHGVRRVKCRRGLRVSRYEGPQGGDSETYYLT